MEDSDSSSSVKTSGGDNDDKEEDVGGGHCHFFEGVEKLLEVWFASSTGKRSSTQSPCTTCHLIIFWGIDF